MSSTKVVQTELEEEEYERLRRVAEKEDKSLKRVLREATEEYTRRYDEIDFDDPFFNADVGNPNSEDEERTAEKTDDYLYGDR